MSVILIPNPIPNILLCRSWYSEQKSKQETSLESSAIDSYRISLPCGMDLSTLHLPSVPSHCASVRKNRYNHTQDKYSGEDSKQQKSFHKMKRVIQIHYNSFIEYTKCSTSDHNKTLAFSDCPEAHLVPYTVTRHLYSEWALQF